MTGKAFEDVCVRELFNAGYWVHRIHPDDSGQQPFDIIAIKENRICAYDAKVCKNKRFPMDRLECNQYNAFITFLHKVKAKDVGLLIYYDGKIHFASIAVLELRILNDSKSISIDLLPVWRP